MSHVGETASTIAAADSVDDLIGDTPLLSLESFAENLYGKVEAGNPYSVKDRDRKSVV